MKVNVISADSDIVSSMVFGEFDERTRDRSRRRAKSLGSRLIGAAKEMYRETVDRMEVLFDPALSRIARRITRSMKSNYQRDVYSYLTDQESIANSSNKMREMIVSMPRVQRMIRQQRIEGWGIRPDSERMNYLFGEDPYDRAANNGLSKAVSINDQERWVSDYEYGANEVDDSPVFLEDQLDIQATFHTVNDLLDDGIDPTSALGESING